MLRTVLWQRDHAVTGYVELQYDASPWEQIAADYQKSERLLLSPLLSLLAYRLVRVAAERERLNATIVDDALHVYSTVNLGFTIQSDRTLYLAVVQNAAAMSCREFVSRLGDLQRSALGHRLRSADLTGATVSFSSMARWNVSRHVPVLPPFTSLIVAHAATATGVGTLGATYVLQHTDNLINAIAQFKYPKKYLRRNVVRKVTDDREVSLKNLRQIQRKKITFDDLICIQYLMFFQVGYGIAIDLDHFQRDLIIIGEHFRQHAHTRSDLQ